MELRRTPLYDRHVAAGAKLVDFAGWEMPVQYAGGRDEHMAVREACGIFDVSHMGEIETSGPQALELLQRLLSNDVAKIAVGGAQYSVLCREDGGVLDDLFTYRLDPERYLTVTNASNHERDLAWFQAHAADLPDVQVSDAIDSWAMLAVQGPLAREFAQAISDAPLPARMTVGERHMAGAEVLVCGTGYTGEDGVELLCAPGYAPGLWNELVRRGAVRAGVGGRGTSSPPRSTGRASPARATRCSAAARSPAARSRPASGWASAWPTSRQRARPWASAWRSTCAVAPAPRPSRAARWSPSTAEAPAPRRVPIRTATVRTCRAPPELRSDANGPGQLSRGPPLPPRARLGEDRSRRPRARDPRHHLVRAGLTRRGRLLRSSRRRPRAEQGRGLRRGRVRQGGLRRDLAALGGDRRGQQRARGEPRDDQRGPLRGGLAGQGPPVRRGRARGADGRRLLQGDARRLGWSVLEPLHLHHPGRPRGDARGDRRRIAAGDLRPPDPRGGAPGPGSRPAPGAPRAGGLRAPARARRAQRQQRGRAELPRRGDVRPLRARADRHAHRAFGVPDALHALPAGDLPGRPAGDVRVPDGRLRAHRPARLQRLDVRGPLGGGRGGLPGQAAQRARPLRRQRGAAPALDRDAAHLRPRIRDGGRRGGAAGRRGRRRHGPRGVGPGDRRGHERGDLRAAQLLRRGRGRRGAERGGQGRSEER